MAIQSPHISKKMQTVTIIDYGVGNLLSVCRALEHIGASFIIASEPSLIHNADRIILPGVGAFGNCSRRLKKLGFWEPILQFQLNERPILGICVGMQLLLRKSFEFGEHQGFGFIDGTIEKIPTSDETTTCRIVPNVGWHELTFDGVNSDKIFAKTPRPFSAYFTHSFYACPKNCNVTSKINYNGFEMCSSVKSNNVRGMQFHPEKSGRSGLKILSNFVQL